MATMNVTTIDTMKGEFELKGGNKKPNPYDLGFWTNLALFFDYDVWMWWYPKDKVVGNDGVGYPMRPPVRLGEMKEEDDRELGERKEARSLGELHEGYDEYYKNTVFIFAGKKYYLNKKESKNETLKNKKM